MGDAFRFSDLPPPATNEEDIRALTDWLADDTGGHPAAFAGTQAANIAPPPFPGYLSRHASGADSRSWDSPAAHLPAPAAPLQAPAEASSWTAAADGTQGSGVTGTGSGSGTGTRSGRSATASLDEEDKRRVREKNKHAQKRYREKQRDKMADLEQRAETLKGQLERVNAESAALQRRNQVLSKIVELKQTHISTLTEVVKVNEERLKGGKENGDPPTITGPEAVHGLSPITIEQCRNMQHADIVQRWRAYAERMASLLIEAEMPNPSQDCMDRLHQACKDSWHCLQTMALSKPMVLKLLLVSNLQTGGWDDPRKNDEAFWRAAITPLQLDQGQQEQLLYVASMFMVYIGHIHKQHGELSNQVLELLPQTRGKRKVAAIVKLADTMMTIQKTQTRSDQEGITFATISLAEILTPIQFARFATQAYPLFPNPVQIAKLLMTDMTEAQRAKMEAASLGINMTALKSFVDGACERLAK